MQRNSISKLCVVVSAVLMVGGLLISASPALADSGDRPCSNQTLHGNYGSTAEGSILPAPGVSLPFRSVGLTRFDGRGNLAFLEHTVINGVSVDATWTASSGTYSVNPDCTGTMVLNTVNSPVPLHLHIVVVNSGKEMRSVLDNFAITSEYLRVE